MASHKLRPLTAVTTMSCFVLLSLVKVARTQRFLYEHDGKRPVSCLYDGLYGLCEVEASQRAVA